MKFFLEICNAKKSWHDLSKSEREEFLRPVASLMEKLEENGTQIIAWGFNDSATPERAAYDYFAAFHFQNEAAAREYHRIFTSAGWYNYFEQVNILGESKSYPAIMNELVGL